MKASGIRKGERLRGGNGGWNFVFLGLCLTLVGALAETLPQTKLTARSRSIGFDREKDSEFVDVVNRVNSAFEESWRKAGLQPPPAALLLTVARRLSLGLTGTLPSLEEIRALEAESDPTGQGWLTRLFADRRFSDYLAERLARAYVGVEDGPFLIYRRHRMVDWLSEQIQRNRPYDEIVRQLIDARGIWTTQPEVNFITVTVDQNEKGKGPDEMKLAGRVSRAFLGVRLNCVQCHDDFLGDRWKQKDFHELAAFFAPADMSLTGVQDDLTRKYRVRYHGRKEEEEVKPAVPFQSELLQTEGTLRERLARWVTHPQNRAFARTTVNRLWALLFNRPLVEPVDDIPLEGPFPPGFEILADDLVAHHYNLQRLIRLIAATRVFQLDSAAPDQPQGVTEAHEKSFAAFPLTRLRPEQMAGGVIQASSLHTINAESHVIFRISRALQLNEFLKRYGDVGEDEFNSRSGTVAQRLLLMNGRLVSERSEENIALNASTRIALLAPDDAAAVESAYLCVLTRRPTAAERDYFGESLKGRKGKERFRVMEDLFWTLLNSTEFSWNH